MWRYTARIWKKLKDIKGRNSRGAGGTFNNRRRLKRKNWRRRTNRNRRNGGGRNEKVGG